MIRLMFDGSNAMNVPKDFKLNEKSVCTSNSNIERFLNQSRNYFGLGKEEVNRAED